MKTEKLNFTLDIENGFPPIGVETLNARPREDGTFDIMNTPFFVKETAYGDVVNARRNTSGRLEFVGCVQQSSYKAISVIFLTDDVKISLLDDFDWGDCIVEFGEFPGYRMLAIAIPGTADYARIKSLLDAYESDGQLSYAELVA